jgi:hypothetical protein
MEFISRLSSTVNGHRMTFAHPKPIEDGLTAYENVLLKLAGVSVPSGHSRAPGYRGVVCVAFPASRPPEAALKMATSPSRRFSELSVSLESLDQEESFADMDGRASRVPLGIGFISSSFKRGQSGTVA